MCLTESGPHDAAAVFAVSLKLACEAKKVWQRETQNPGSGTQELWQWPAVPIRLLVQAEAVAHVRGQTERRLVADDQASLAELAKTAVMLPAVDAHR